MTQINIVRVAELARRQHGVISRGQLAECGIAGGLVATWVARHRLHRVLPGVYALGHRAVPIAGRLRAALLCAGEGSALSHQTAAWCWDLLTEEPETIHLSTTRQLESQRGIRLHRRAHDVPRVRRRGLWVTPVGRTLLDCASLLDYPAVRRMVAEADFGGRLDERDVRRQLGRGRPGSSRLRRALDEHLPELARSRSVLEDRFLTVVQTAGLPHPIVNATVEGLMVDALWPEERIVVELDGAVAHSSPHQVARDRERELRLRRAGYLVLRYSWSQITERPDEVIADLRATLAARATPNDVNPRQPL